MKIEAALQKNDQTSNFMEKMGVCSIQLSGLCPNLWLTYGTQQIFVLLIVLEYSAREEQLVHMYYVLLY